MKRIQRGAAVAAVALVGLIGAVALAAEREPGGESFLTKTYTQCMDRSGGVTAAMMDCMGAEYARQDVTLNRNYQALLKVYAKEPAMVAKLRAAQRLWGPWVEAQIAANLDPMGGSSQGLEGRSMSQDAVVRRHQEFQELLDIRRYGLTSSQVRGNFVHQSRACARASSASRCDSRALSNLSLYLSKTLSSLRASHSSSPDYLGRLTASQRTFESYRDANCALLISAGVYRLAKSPFVACKVDETRYRLFDFKR